MDYVRDTFKYKKKYAEMAKNIIDQFVRHSGKENVTTVSVHVRRGDRLTEDNFKQGYRVPEFSYYMKAMTYFREKFNHTIFIVVTEDPVWVENNFSGLPGVYLALGNDYKVDFAILFQCDYVIQSVGTFGRFAAILNGKESVYFRDGMMCNTNPCDVSKYVPSSHPILPIWKRLTN